MTGIALKRYWRSLTLRMNGLLWRHRYHVVAISLSVGGHVVLGFLLGSDGRATGDGVVSTPVPRTGMLIAQLHIGDDLSKPAVPHVEEAGKISEKYSGNAKSLFQAESIPRYTTALTSIFAHPAPHYYRVSELTQKPIVLHDGAPSIVLDLPGLSPQPAIFRLLINEQGEVDEVLIEESYLPEQTERLLMDSFSKTKFQPGKINNASVRSQLRIEVSLDSVAELR